MPRRSAKPPSTQKWKKNVRTGGGVVIPCTWELETTKEQVEGVKECIAARLPDVEGHENMEV